MSRQPKGPRVSVEQRLQVVLSVLSGEVSMSEAARRVGVSTPAVAKWRDRFLAAGREALLDDRLSGPAKAGESVAERRMRHENEQLKLALAEATVQLRIWKKGASLVDEVPSKTSRP
jgi:transposase